MIYFQISIPVKDTLNPISHHALASLNFFNWMQALAPVKAWSTDVTNKTFLMSCRWRKILIRGFYIKIKWIKIIYWSYPTDLKDESYFCRKKNSAIKILVRDLWVKGCYLRHVHTISDGFSWRHEKPPGIVSTSIRYVTLYFRDRRGAASLRHINHAALPIFVYEQKPYTVWWRRKSYPA